MGEALHRIKYYYLNTMEGYYDEFIKHYDSN